jgi:hypothetical protein
LVDPPRAAFRRTAFSKAVRVRIVLGVRSSETISTIRRPARWASRLRRESAAGQAALSGSCMPKISARQARVEAVPIVMQ